MNKKERPVLSNLIKDGTSKIEQFQNDIIRPVIKMQHNLIISLFKNYLKKRKVDFINITEEKQQEKIKTILTKDNRFKNIYLGTVIGHFSAEELDFYHLNAPELNRRIIQIIIQRLKDSISTM